MEFRAVNLQDHPAQMSEPAPKPVLSLFDVIAATAGIVIGAGLFRLPSAVAADAGSEAWFLGFWLAGGLVSLIGALCYAELSTAFPSTGGEYHFLTGAFGSRVGFLFAWARVTVAQTGNIVLLAFVFGDYLATAAPLGAYGPSIYAALSVAAVTLLNAAGLRLTAAVQRWLFVATMAGLGALFMTGLSIDTVPAVAAAVPGAPGLAAVGSAMVLVLFTYGGWNEAAYVSAEVRDGARNMSRALIASIAVITTCYVAVNWTYVTVLGLDGVAASTAVASDVMRRGIGDTAAAFMTALVLVVVLKSMNVATLTGARTAYALGRDTPALGFFGRWNAERNAPTRALALQLAMALAFIGFGSLSRSGIETTIDYLSPVFWLFFLLTGLSLFVLRAKFPRAERPYRVPLYPLTPLVFCVSCAFMLYASIDFAGSGALVGLGVLVLGVPVMMLARARPLKTTARGQDRSD